MGSVTEFEVSLTHCLLVFACIEGISMYSVVKRTDDGRYLE